MGHVDEAYRLMLQAKLATSNWLSSEQHSSFKFFTVHIVNACSILNIYVNGGDILNQLNQYIPGQKSTVKMQNSIHQLSRPFHSFLEIVRNLLVCASNVISPFRLITNFPDVAFPNVRWQSPAERKRRHSTANLLANALKRLNIDIPHNQVRIHQKRWCVVYSLVKNQMGKLFCPVILRAKCVRLVTPVFVLQLFYPCFRIFHTVEQILHTPIPSRCYWSKTSKSSPTFHSAPSHGQIASTYLAEVRYRYAEYIQFTLLILFRLTC